MGSPAENIARAFGGEFRNGQGFIPTPGHSAKDRGTTVCDADGGGVVFHSFNGGDWRALKQECETRGLLPERENRSTAAWRETGHYEYVGADGTVAYRTVRKEKAGERKRFVAQRPDGRGGWANGLGELSRVLYRLPDVLAADPSAVIYLTEGERKADKIASWGMVATAVAFGAKGWRDTYAEALAGRTVAILPDNDDEGRGFADRAAASIMAAGGVPVIVSLPGLPAKGDVIDWSGMGGSALQLQELTEAAMNAPAVMPQILPIADLAAWSRTSATPTPFYMAGHIPQGEVTLLTGAGGGNKSTFGQQLATCSAAALAMLGVDVMEGSALYITAEDHDDRLHWMQEHICRALGVDMASLSGKLFLASIRGRLNNELATFDADGRLQVRETYQLVRSTIEATGAKLVVLDNVAHLFAGNENDRGQVTAFVNLLYSLCGELGVTIVLIAHRNKAGDTYSGSTAWLNAVRSQLVIERPENGQDPDARVLTIGKANYARPDQQLAFRWHDFALILDSDLPDDTRRELAAAIQTSSDNATFLDCLNERNRQRRQVSDEPNAANFAPKKFEGMREAKGLNRQRLELAMERLFAIGAIERGFLYRDTAEGKDIHGLRQTGWEVPESPPEGDRKVHPEGSGKPQETTGNSVPISKDIPGAATWAAAPFRDNEAIEIRGASFAEPDPADTVFE